MAATQTAAEKNWNAISLKGRVTRRGGGFFVKALESKGLTSRRRPKVAEPFHSMKDLLEPLSKKARLFR